MNSTGRFLGLVCAATWLILQAPAALVGSSSAGIAVGSGTVRGLSFDRKNISKESAAKFYCDLPLGFEPNYGQTDSQVKFLSRGTGYNLYLTAKEAVMEFCAPEGHSSTNAELSVLRMKLVGANSGARIIALDELPGKSNYFIGSDPKGWRTNVPTCSRVKYKSIYPGVDAVFYGNQRELDYDFIVAPGADFTPIRMTFEGARRIRLDKSGDLVIETSMGEICQRKPAIYQESEGIRKQIAGCYVAKGKREIRIQLGPYDKSKQLVIDPVLSYAALLANGNASAIAVDAAGNIYVTGSANPIGFPTTPGTFQTNPGGGDCSGVVCNDAFVAKLNSAETALVYCTYLGGSGLDSGNGIAIDASGNAYVTGTTNAKDFPTTPGAFRAVLNTGVVSGSSLADAFVTKLNPSGSALVYSTYLGGSDNDQGLAIAVDASGNAYVTGDTLSRNFPTTADSRQSVFVGGTCIQGDAAFRCTDAFVTKLNAIGSGLVYSTFLGGDSADQGTGIAVDASGSAYITGVTSSANFPATAGAFQTSYRGDLSFGDAFVTKLNPAGSDFVYSTYIGGSGRDSGKGIAVDLAGNAYVTGTTSSTNFPVTSGVFQPVSASSSFFKSTNGGSTWDNASTGLPSDFGLGSLVIDPAVPSRLYAGTGWGVYKSTDGGAGWSATRLLNVDARALAIDPKNPSILYVGSARISGADIFKSTDGGGSWLSIILSRDSFIATVNAIAIDPQESSIIYASTTASAPGDLHQGVFKSTDGGGSWISASEGFARNTTDVRGLVINPVNPSTLYANAGGVYRTTNGGIKWKLTAQLPVVPTSILVDPANSNVLYAATNIGIFRSPDGGKKWKLLNAGPPGTVLSLMIHPADPSIAYASALGGAVSKSTNSGGSWNAITSGLTDERGALLALDPRSPTTLYVQSGGGTEAFATKLNAAGSALIYSSYLGGGTSDHGNAIAVDAAGNAYITGSTNSNNFPVKETLQSNRNSRFGEVDNVFVTKVNPTGSALIFSTYLGGGGFDRGQAIAVDAAGNAYVTGFAFSDPSFTSIVDPVRFGDGSDAAFIVKIAEAASGLPAPEVTGISPSRGQSTGRTAVTIIGSDFVRGAIVRIAGVPAISVEVVNSTTIKATTGAHTGRLQPFDVVVTNPDGQSNTLINAFTYVAPPRIVSVSLMGKKLIVTGEGFDSGAVILVDDTEQKTLNDESNPTAVLIAKKAGRSIAPGQRVTVRVRNADGSLSEAFSFTRPVE